ncbi:MAG: hypothetical protein HC858_06185 [Brachymonas sp.]|nr:hypothetical protein [Brachymonas sp.]
MLEVFLKMMGLKTGQGEGEVATIARRIQILGSSKRRYNPKSTSDGRRLAAFQTASRYREETSSENPSQKVQSGQKSQQKRSEASTQVER